MTISREEFRKALADAGALDVFGREVRMARSDVEIRQDEDGEVRLQGYAAKFNKETVIGGWFKFREKISDGAFAKTIKEADIRHLFNHDPNWVLGRNKAGTLQLTEDATGLYYDVDLNMNDPQAVSVREKVERGDVTQSSFAFVVLREEWREPDDPDSGELPLRTILEAKLYDTSSVTYPAYEDTSALISSASRGMVVSELGLNEVAPRIAMNDFNPDLAPALREAARRAEELAIKCEGDSCSQAAEEAPVETEERAAEEALEEEPETEENASSVDMSFAGITLRIQATVADEAPEADEVEDISDEQDRRRRELELKQREWENLRAKANAELASL